MSRIFYQGKRLADYPGLRSYLPQLLCYPLHFTALCTLILFTLMIWVGLQSLASVVLLVIVTPWLFAYLEAVIVHSADGEAEPPRLGAEQLLFNWGGALKLLLVPALIVSLWWPLWQQHAMLAATVGSLGLFLLPAYLFLASCFGLLTALSPLQIGASILVMGWPYLIASAALAASIWMVFFFVSEIAVFASIMLVLYVLFVNAHLLGYLAFHRADQLGLDARVALSLAEEQRLDDQAVRLATKLDEVGAALRRKDSQAAIAALRQVPADLVDPVAFHQSLFSALALRPEKIVALEQGQRLLAALLAEREYAQALAIYRQCLDLSRDFFATGLAQLTALARHALAQREHVLFEQMCDAARPYLQAGQTAAIELIFLQVSDLIERGGDDARARNLLLELRVVVQDQALKSRIDGLLRVIGTDSAPP